MTALSRLGAARILLRLRLQLTTGLLVAVVLTACQNLTDSSAPASVSDLCTFAHSADLNLGTSGESDVAKWITAIYKVKPQQTMKTDVDSRVVDYFWQENTRRWSAEVRDGRLARVSQFDLENGPTLGQVAASLGVPEFVYGYVGAICEKSCNYSLGLDYPHLGISVYHSGYETTSQLWEMGAPSLAIQGDMRATEILCYEPAPMDTALRQAFGASMDSLTVQMSMRSPWVGFGARVPLGPR